MLKRSDEEESGKGLSRSQAKAYQWAMEAALSIPIAVGLGWWLDTVFGTSPWLLFFGVVVGLGACIRGLLRMRSLVEETGPSDAGPDVRDDR